MKKSEQVIDDYGYDEYRTKNYTSDNYGCLIIVMGFGVAAACLMLSLMS